MNTEPKPSDSVESDSSAELGSRDPVRDKAKLGDSQYSVTPPRHEVTAPQSSDGFARCNSCSTELDPNRSYRPDAEEYVYHFCGAECYARWRETAEHQRSHPQQNT